MKPFPRIKIRFSFRLEHILICLSFFIWIFLFRRFITGAVPIFSDAIPYYDHIRYFLDNIKQGVYPLWNPFLFKGSPNEFFLLRICPYNPFYAIILILDGLGCSEATSYFSFFGIYFFIGCVAFFLTVKTLLQDRRVALASFLLLFFSSLGTRIFDSYLIFVSIPLLCFICSLVKFSCAPSRFRFLCLYFFLLILLTTYIPLYFFTLMVCFLLVFFVVYLKKFFQEILPRYLTFIRSNKLLTLAAVIVLFLALIPSALFFQSASGGDVVMPARHYKYGHTPDPGQNQLSVDLHMITEWAISEDIAFSFYYTNLRRFKYAVFFIPIFIYPLLLLGIFMPINRRLFFYFLLGGLIYLIGIPEGFPLYRILYNKIFYFKYFRNLHFFLWFALLPLFVLFCMELFKSFLDSDYSKTRNKFFLFILAFFSHAAIAWILFLRKDAIISSYVAVGLSFLFFAGHLSGLSRRAPRAMLVLLFAAIVIQPLEVYSYMEGNVLSEVEKYDYGYVRPRFKLCLGKKLTEKSEYKPTMYYGTRWYSFLLENLNGMDLHNLIRYSFVLYDNVEVVEKVGNNLEEMVNAWEKERNVAFVMDARAAEQAPSQQADGGQGPVFISENDSQFELLKFDVNTARVRTNFNTPKFLVYYDNYDVKWQASVDGKKVPVYRANLSFKGVWVPAGRHIVQFRYGSDLYYALYYFLTFFYYMLLAVIVCAYWGIRKGMKNKVVRWVKG